MAWYPAATRYELQPESDAQPAIRPTQFIVHSIIAPWTAKRTYEFWRDSTNLESHFGLGYEGDLGQFIGTETRADANAGANRRADGTGAVSIETASNTKGTDPWTDAQIRELIELGVWLHKRHGIPLRICRSHADPGFGYHSMFPQWSTSGTACPGKARIRQFREVVFPGIVAAAAGKTPPAPAPSEENDVPTNWNRATENERNLAPAEWTVVSAESADLVTGASAYTGSMFLTLTAPAGGTVQGRWFHVRPDGSRWVGPIAERQTTGGSSFVDFPHAGSVDPAEKVRFEAVYYPADENDTTPASITSARLRGLYWK
ncbi:N-acetylmuramoyl-L-alanine amidase [Streptomyces sp. NPDC006283]|uniref:peptidoglycan recognition protein family protein n=1 Tax=Streptomyces sp. NPDC006283 TaxID=3156741 RepID=UPI0033A961FD